MNVWCHGWKNEWAFFLLINQCQQQQCCSWSGMMPFCPVSRIVDTKWKCVWGPGGALLTSQQHPVLPLIYSFFCFWSFLAPSSVNVLKRRDCALKKDTLWSDFFSDFYFQCQKMWRMFFILRQIFRFCSPSDIIFRFLASWFWILEVFLTLFGPRHSDIAGSQSVHDVRSRRVGCPSTVMF